MTLLLVGTVTMAAGCASTQKRFDRITPGMSQGDVVKAMDAGPSRFENIPDSAYSAWYWGNDYCVLFKDQKAAAKDSTRVEKNVSVGPGSYEETHKAECLAPGQISERDNERSVYIPGVGKVTLPLPKYRSPAKKE